MFDSTNDQAAGLRRIMAGPSTRVLSVLSACSSEHQPRLLTNLAAALSANGRDVLVLHAGDESVETVRSYYLSGLPSLTDVVGKKVALPQAVKHTPQGFYSARLLPKGRSLNASDDNLETSLNTAFNRLAAHFEIVLVDTVLNEKLALPLAALNESEVIVRLTRDPESIKQAYLMIKHICMQFGKRKLGIVVDACSDAQAASVFRNLSQAARRFMLVDLEFYGAIPADEHLNRAAKSGRAVTDAFPKAKASKAFLMFAQRIDYPKISADAEFESLV